MRPDSTPYQDRVNVELSCKEKTQKETKGAQKPCGKGSERGIKGAQL